MYYSAQEGKNNSDYWYIHLGNLSETGHWYCYDRWVDRGDVHSKDCPSFYTAKAFSLPWIA
jgi:hypothetical protein